jgi:hypothetical protein
MMQEIPMNIDSVIFDTLEDGARKTINGIPAGYLSPTYPRLVGGDGKPQPIDMAQIVDFFHKTDGELVCAYTGLPAEGVNVVDSNPNNFLITNLEPIAKKAVDGIPFMPKVRTTKIFHTPEYDLEIELYGVPCFRASQSLTSLTIPEVPSNLGLAYDELELLWVWNELTKLQLLKGLTSLTKRDRKTEESSKLTNESVMEFTFKALHFDVKE